MKLTFRQAQIAALAAVGASNKEIGLILGIAEATVKSIKKRLREIQVENNIDYFGLPIDREGRNAELKKISHNILVRYKFGGQHVEH